MDVPNKITPKREKKKDAIIESAVVIFAAHGYHNTRLEQITDAFHLTDKSIYYYFNSKGDLFIEAILSIQAQLNQLIKSIDAKDYDHLIKIKKYTNHAMSINGLTLLMQLPKSLADFARYHEIKANEEDQYKVWGGWFRKGQLEGSIIQGNPSEQRNFLFGSLFYLHRWYSIKDTATYDHIQPFIENMIDRMYSTKYNKTI